jgi:SIR2-like domain
MNRIALLGAGFTHNWGGLLSVEFNGRLLQRVGNDPTLQRLLRDGTFEDVLAQLQSSQPGSETLRRLQEAITVIFDRMNQGLVDKDALDFSNDLRFSVRKFLSQFDAIFSLNQDLLLELHYNSVELLNRQRWPHGHHFPGLRPPPNARNGPLWERKDAIWRIAPEAEYSVEPNSQPIFKLHGSTNWRNQQNEDILVIGRGKQDQIRRHDLLRWYLDRFRESLRKRDTRLMAIGYGFRDDHIDEEIAKAHEETGQLSLCFVGPRGRNVLNRQSANQIRVPRAIDAVPCCGESTRDFKATFSGDIGEITAFEDFFRA